MDNQEHLPVLSRDEYIRLARESCTRNLSYTNGATKNYGTYKNLKSENPKLWNRADVKNRFSMGRTGLNIPAINLKSFLIRIICALMLFLTIFIIDKFGVKLKAFNSKYIQEMVSSNKSIEDAENFFVSLFEDFVKTEE